jgi:tRNA threonylcarbamoyladenosine dehydratase
VQPYDFVAPSLADIIQGYPIDYVPGKARDKMYDGILAFVQSSEEKIVRRAINIAPDEGLGLKIPLNTGDIAFLVEDLYKGKSVVTGLPTKLVLIRWNKPTGRTMVRIGEGEDEQRTSDIRIRHLVCMTKEEAIRHQKEVLHGNKTPEDLYSRETIELVESRVKEAQEYEKYRR